MPEPSREPAREPAREPTTHGLHVLAVDDEPPALNELVYLLEQAEGIARVTPAGSAAEALAALQDHEFDAVFLDIRMPGIDGLALAGILARFATPPPVVFVTAYDTHAVDAFEVAAVDYLLKPIRAERLGQAITRVRRRLADLRAATSAADPGVPGDARHGPPSRGDQLAGNQPGAQPSAPAAAPADETIAVELGGVTRYVRRSEVVYVEAQRDYVRLCTRTGGHLVRVPLATLEERWAPVGFLRVHRRFLVNSSYVEGLRSSAGIVSVDLGERQSVPVSRRFTAAVRAALVQRHRIDRDQRPRGTGREAGRDPEPGAQPDPEPGPDADRQPQPGADPQAGP